MKQLKLLFEADDVLPLRAALRELLLQILCISNKVKQRQKAGLMEQQKDRRATARSEQ